MKVERLILFISLIFTFSYAFDSYKLRNLIGYTIIDVKTINGDFNGCDFGKRIVFMDGAILVCNTYHYHYSFSPDAVILAKSFNYKGRKGFSIKMIVDDYVYDMEPIFK